MISRNEYLDNLINLRDKQLIKVITGIRRCGKSTLFELYQEYLLRNSVESEQIISINLEDGDYADIDDSKSLYNLVKTHLLPDKMNYIFLDEVQRVSEFQKAVDSLFIKKNCDVYITGSNAYLLSGELATLLSGRYIEIKMLPLSFKEYVSAFPEDRNIDRLYQNYIHNSSFPYTLELSRQKDIRQYLEGIFNSIILKDIVARRRFPDIAMLQSVVRFMFDNIGNLCSTKKIADTMTSAGRKITVHTVESYLTALTDSFIFYRIGRYDIKGKQYLKTGDKYYAADIGLRYIVLGSKKADQGHILENVVYLELLRRGYEVYIGKVGNSEVDFIALGDEGEEYYQVAYTVIDADGKTLERELKPLESIRDHNPKYLLTMDLGPVVSHNGIKQMNVLDWLLK
ncbi:ATP-binding protein [Lachnospiraceae bacterium ASD3451]|uniref:ATP-binding protein n=1 Tax=Diplocloster agilis TaxID=2850323 RepID=UPI001D302FB7|nr:ATP-binding protein [Diplocloster agilis]MBU9745623.1 ATP-binding protein [Diplocloster agilis]